MTGLIGEGNKGGCTGGGTTSVGATVRTGGGEGTIGRVAGVEGALVKIATGGGVIGKYRGGGMISSMTAGIGRGEDRTGTVEAAVRGSAESSARRPMAWCRRSCDAGSRAETSRRLWS